MPQSSVAQVFADSQKKLGSFIKRRVSIVEDAEDILQEVFYQFSRVSELGEPIEQPAAWLYRVARNLIINRYKKKQEDFLDEISDVLFGEETTPETEYLRGLILDEIKGAVNELPPEQREVFELTEYYDMPVKEIAENTGVSVNTVLSRKHYAVLHLRKTLRELYENVVGK
jgi:RNA polymerase sigma factor (sigma-70 family)